MKWLIWLWLALLALDATAGDIYRIEPEHTRVSFDVRRFGVRWINARFRQIEGRFVIDRDGRGSEIDVSVATDSLDGLDFGWNARLRSKDWLDTQRFPRMTFRSSHVEFNRKGAVAAGQLVLHGYSRPVLLVVDRLDCSGAPPEEPVCWFAAHTDIKRSDFGLPRLISMKGTRHWLF